MCIARFCRQALPVALLISACASTSSADEPKLAPLDRKSLDERVARILRVVYHEGAVELYNRSRQSEAAYYFQGALTTIEPFLDHHPELQRAVVKGLADARKITNLDDRAWRLRDVLVTIQRTVEPEPNPDSLWARLGGEKKVKKIVSEWVDACIDDPKVNFSRNGKYKLTAKQATLLKERMVDLASAVTGGPREYSGKTMKEAHKGMGITDAEFTLAVSKLKIALLRNEVAPKDVERILGILDSTRADIVAAGAAAVEEPKDTLWQRLGGEEKVKKIISDYVDAALADPKINYTRNGKYKMSAERVAGLKSQLVDLASSLGGGPRKYQGRTMKEIHKGLGITDSEFDALLAAAKRTLIRHEVAEADREKILAALESTRADIVEVKAEAPRKQPERDARLSPPLREPEGTVPVGATALRGEKYLPNDSDAVVIVDVQRLLNAPPVRRNLDAIKRLTPVDAKFQSVLNQLGLELKDIETVLLGFPGDDRLLGGMIVLQGHFDSRKMLAAAEQMARNDPSFAQVEKDGGDYLLSFAGCQVALMDETILVGAHGREVMREALAKKRGKLAPGRKQALAELLAPDDGKQIIRVAAIDAFFQAELKGLAQSLAGGLAVDEDIKLNCTITAGTAAKAEQIESLAKVAMQNLRPLINSVGKIKDRRLAPLSEVADTFAAQRNGMQVTIRAECSKRTIERFEKLLKETPPARGSAAPARQDFTSISHQGGLMALGTYLGRILLQLVPGCWWCA